MKALVLEIREDKAAILTSEGQIIKVNNKQYRVGQEIIFKGPKEKIVDMTRYVRRWGTAIAAALFLFVSLGVSYVTLKPYGVVSLDVNPSIEFTINRFDRVLNLSGVNDDGRDIVACIDEKKLIYKNIEQAIDITLDTLRAEGYLKEEKDNYVVVAANTVKEDHTDKLVGKLDQSISSKDNVESIAMKASDDELMEAREMGTTAGKMMIVEKLNGTSKEKINKGDWINKSVAAIVKECDKNAADTMVASAEPVKNQGQAATPGSTSMGLKNSGGTTGSEESDNSNNANNVKAAASTGSTSGASGKSQKTNKSSKSASTVEKSSEASEPSSKAPEASGKTSVPVSTPSNDGGTSEDVTAVGAASDTPTAPAKQTTVEIPAVTDPVVTPLPVVNPTGIPVAEPVVTPVSPVTPETPVVQPDVPEAPTVQPTVTPTEPAPSQPEEPAQPSQPSEPSTPSAPSEPSQQESGSSVPPDQGQTTGQDQEPGNNGSE